MSETFRPGCKTQNKHTRKSPTIVIYKGLENLGLCLALGMGGIFFVIYLFWNRTLVYTVFDNKLFRFATLDETRGNEDEI